MFCTLRRELLADPSTIAIDTAELVEKLRQVEALSDGELARVIELLLLENHVLMQHQSIGFRRGIPYQFSEFPRFLNLNNDPDDKTADVSEDE